MANGVIYFSWPSGGPVPVLMLLGSSSQLDGMLSATGNHNLCINGSKHWRARPEEVAKTPAQTIGLKYQLKQRS